MSDPVQAGKDEGAARRKKKVPLWLVLLIAAVLGVTLALLFPMTR
jgi:hypothetical protein